MTTRRKRRDFGAVRQLPSGRWQASYLAVAGLRRTAPSTFTTKADAHAWLIVRQSESLTGDWIDPHLGRVTFGEFATRWIAEHRLSPRTRDLYEGLHRLHIGPFLGTAQLGSLTTERVRAWRAELLTSGRSEGTVAKAYRLLRAVLNTAVDDGRIARNPCRIKRADTTHAPERPVASVAQVFALAEAVGPQYRAFVMTAALTSLRWGELIALRRRDVDLDARVAVVHRSLIEHKGRLEAAPPKNNSVRVVTLPDVLVADLRGHLLRVSADQDALVFTGSGRRHRVGATGVPTSAGAMPSGRRVFPRDSTFTTCVTRVTTSLRSPVRRPENSCTGWATRRLRAALIYQHATESRGRDLADRLDALVKAQHASLEQGPERAP